MPATVRSLSEVPEDNPILNLFRRKVQGENMLWACVELKQGCVVEPHRHESEQIAFVISGKVLWQLGEPGSGDYEEREVGDNTVLVLPPNFQHGVRALEDTLILDVLSPVGMMGVDRQG